jgi:hypothetical protein
MTIYLVFESEADAEYTANGITAALGLPTQPENVTTHWNNVRQRNDGKWVLMWPGRNELIPPDAPSFVVEEYNSTWFETQEVLEDPAQ